MNEATKKMILEFVQEEYLDDDQQINYETPLISGGIVDSFSMISLKRFLESEFNIRIPDEEATAEAFDTINNIADIVAKHK